MGRSQPADWSRLRPRRLREFQERGTGEAGPLVSVRVPRFRTGWLGRLVERVGLRPYQVHLDAFGSFVWLRCDGTRQVHEIGEALLDRFGDDVAPVEQRLATFLQQLERAKLIALESNQ